jgi:Na+/melibiose symporter-like transporter
VFHLVEKYYGSWDLPAIAPDTLSLIWTLLFFTEVLGIAMASTGVAGG